MSPFPSVKELRLEKRGHGKERDISKPGKPEELREKNASEMPSSAHQGGKRRRNSSSCPRLVLLHPDPT